MMRKTPFIFVTLALYLSLHTTASLHAQQNRLVIAVESECLNAHIYRLDDLGSFVEDLNLRFIDNNVAFLEANGNLHAPYLLRIKYKKDPPGGYSKFHFIPANNTRGGQELVGPIGYPQFETTPQERASSAATRSPGSQLIPYSVPLLTNPGHNMPQSRLAIPASSKPGLPSIRRYDYFYLNVELIDIRDQSVIWSYKKKTNKFEDIYIPMIDQISAYIGNL